MINLLGRHKPQQACVKHTPSQIPAGVCQAGPAAAAKLPSSSRRYAATCSAASRHVSQRVMPVHRHICKQHSKAKLAASSSCSAASAYIENPHHPAGDAASKRLANIDKNQQQHTQTNTVAASNFGCSSRSAKTAASAAVCMHSPRHSCCRLSLHHALLALNSPLFSQQTHSSWKPESEINAAVPAECTPND